MKRALKVTICILLAIATVITVYFVLTKTGILGVKLFKPTVSTFTTDSGKLYTVRNWKWTPVEFTGKINKIESASLPSKKVLLSVDKDSYYAVRVPDKNYITDFGKTIYAEDGSYMIRIMSDIDSTNLGVTAGITDPILIDSRCIATNENAKGKRTIARLLNETVAVVADVYYGDDTYSIISDSIINNKTVTNGQDATFAPDAVQLSDIRYQGKYVGQVTFQKVDLQMQKYLFADGYLWIQSDVNPMADIKDRYLRKLVNISSSNISSYYMTSGMIYAEAGDYTLGMLAYNTNTTIVLLGQGEEARCNIISILNYLR